MVSAVEEGVVGDVEDADEVRGVVGEDEAAVAAVEIAGSGHGWGWAEETEFRRVGRKKAQGDCMRVGLSRAPIGAS